MVGEEDENSVALTSKKTLELLEKDGLLTRTPPTTFTSPARKEFMILTDLFGDETAFCVCTRCSKTALEVCTGADTNRKHQRTPDEFSTVAPDRSTKRRVTESKARLILDGQYGLMSHPTALSRDIVKSHKLAQLDLAVLLRTLVLVPNDSMAGALTVSLWEEKYSRLHYLGLTVHYVEEFVLKVRRFALLKFDPTATDSAANIENQFCGLFRDRFKIPVVDIRAISTKVSIDTKRLQ
ncbi:uncharacterized protein PHALS_04990 [Plasmopara halstedii]|uniref:Uncharacterized protein n=1 Tax=Plasmopara halstedii TaxID=4781 RepID=A0A0P1A9I8_PLAHL|nr:uncharacterized protein PHALS_04990 [Plasmopara halstedii]CEG37396.1 hypothetical protein PHALS_04990 [Plasmopara halstedii]|eukprot:XP_024573765.1 hypothetical protein PHALS_04990 [Plasmopara halstedii]